MKIGVDTLIAGYYETIKDEYPDLTLDEVSKIVKAPFKHLKMMMRQPNLPTIKWKYFGSFLVYSKKLETLYPLTSLLKGAISERKFFKLSEIVEHNNKSKTEEA